MGNNFSTHLQKSWKSFLFVLLVAKPYHFGKIWRWFFHHHAFYCTAFLLNTKNFIYLSGLKCLLSTQCLTIWSHWTRLFNHCTWSTDTAIVILANKKNRSKYSKSPQNFRGLQGPQFWTVLINYYIDREIIVPNFSFSYLI